MHELTIDLPPPPRIPVANKGLWRFPTRNGIILLVTGILGRGVVPTQDIPEVYKVSLINKPKNQKGKVGAHPWESTRYIYQHIPEPN